MLPGAEPATPEDQRLALVARAFADLTIPRGVLQGHSAPFWLIMRGIAAQSAVTTIDAAAQV